MNFSRNVHVGNRSGKQFLFQRSLIETNLEGRRLLSPVCQQPLLIAVTFAG